MDGGTESGKVALKKMSDGAKTCAVTAWVMPVIYFYQFPSGANLMR